MARGRSPGFGRQREAILARAAELFADKGFAGTTMNEVAVACGLSKPTLYHYFTDKYQLLLQIADGHVSRLGVLTDEVRALGLDPETRLRELIHRFVGEYAQARHAHRVLTEDVRFLTPEDRERVLDKERAVVRCFADAIGELRPDAEAAGLARPVTMLLFGMMNWMFTWVRQDGPLDEHRLARLVADMCFGGVPGLRADVSLPDRGLVPSSGLPSSGPMPHRRHETVPPAGKPRHKTGEAGQ